MSLFSYLKNISYLFSLPTVQWSLLTSIQCLWIQALDTCLFWPPAGPCSAVSPASLPSQPPNPSSRVYQNVFSEENIWSAGRTPWISCLILVIISNLLMKEKFEQMQARDHSIMTLHDAFKKMYLLIHWYLLQPHHLWDIVDLFRYVSSWVELCAPCCVLARGLHTKFSVLGSSLQSCSQNSALSHLFHSLPLLAERTVHFLVWIYTGTFHYSQKYNPDSCMDLYCLFLSYWIPSKQIYVPRENSVDWEHGCFVCKKPRFNPGPMWSPKQLYRSLWAERLEFPLIA